MFAPLSPRIPQPVPRQSCAAHVYLVEIRMAGSDHLVIDSSLDTMDDIETYFKVSIALRLKMVNFIY